MLLNPKASDDKINKKNFSDMHNFYNNNFSEDTIAAIATSFGPAAISVIRISGKDAIKIAESCFSGKISKYKSHTVHFGKVLDKNKKTIDSVLLTPMLAPKSYTGEDSIEISCHGGTLITKKVYERVIEAGARPANPGEFTFRAFMNKKIDLLQAEAVQELIFANNEMALKAAENQLEGKLSQLLTSLQKELLEIASIVEAWVDFPEEDLEFTSKEELISRLEKTKNELENLSRSFHEGKILFEGIELAIIGTPNVGKSSLMNALCQKDRAIVTPIAGTTRDLLEEKILLGPFHFNIIDTAGIRKTNEEIEKEGIRRSLKAFKEADIVLLVLDASKDLSTDDLELLEQVNPHKTIVLWNKIDLEKQPPDLHCKNSAYISAKENIGIDSLKQKIEQLIWSNTPQSKDATIITKMHHKNKIDESIHSCEKTILGLQNATSAEFIALEMRHGLNCLSSILGNDVTEDLLTTIFSKFCIGK